MRHKHALVVTLTYPPDPGSVGQHASDVAEDLVHKGWRVTVYTSDRGYQDRGQKFPRNEEVNGVSVRRLAWTSFGKKTLFHRIAAQVSFVIQVIIKSILLKECGLVIVTTNLAFVVAPILKKLKGTKSLYWVMDLNPDQAIAAGMVKKKSLSAYGYNRLQSAVLSSSDAVVSLDRHMHAKVSKKTVNIRHHFIIPPWPHEAHMHQTKNFPRDFKELNRWGGKRVFMYSGNHSLVHPLHTFLGAAEHFSNDDRFVLAFVGDGAGKEAVDQMTVRYPSAPIKSLPYQPMAHLYSSLSSADVHMVSMGDKMSGCVHPCKIYNILALAKPILFLGDKNNHIYDMVSKYDIGWVVEHGDISSMRKTLAFLATVDISVIRKKGENARQLASSQFTQKALMDKFHDAIQCATT